MPMTDTVGHMTSVRHYHRVLSEEATAWIALGWQEYGRDYPPSLSQDVVLIEWCGDGEPKLPQET